MAPDSKPRKHKIDTFNLEVAFSYVSGSEPGAVFSILDHLGEQCAGLQTQKTQN